MEAIQDHSCNISPTCYKQLGKKTVKVLTRCVLAVKHLWLACLILNIDKRHSTNSQRQMMSQYHLSPHLKEEGGRVSGEGAVGSD